MEVMLIYLVKAHVVVSLLYVAYCLLIKNEIFFRLNRFILIGIPVLAIGLPLLPMVKMSLTTDIQQKTSVLKLLPGTFSAADQPLQKNLIINKEIPAPPNIGDIFKTVNNNLQLFIYLYALVVGILLLRYIKQLWNLLHFIKRNEKVSEGGIIYLDLDHQLAPFSFFKYIVINKSQYDAEQCKQIIVHEKAHMDQWHSIDILLAELVNIFLWCNPLVRDLKETIRLNLEYLADREVLNQGFDKTSYQWSILQHYMKLQTYSLASSYNSKPKLRIKKMNSEENPGNSLYKYLCILTVVIATYFIINPLDANALNRLKLQAHQGFYVLQGDRVISVQMLVKNDRLVMKTLWNNKEIWFEKQSESNFINGAASLPLQFAKNYIGADIFIAFNRDTWEKVKDKEYKPVKKEKGQREGVYFVYDTNGNFHTAVYNIDPWEKVADYNLPEKK